MPSGTGLRTYLTLSQVESILNSRTPGRIVGKWYRGQDALCLDCGKRQARFGRFRGDNVDLVCQCGSVFHGTFQRGSFWISIWFGRAYQDVLPMARGAEREAMKRLVRKIKRGLRGL